MQALVLALGLEPLRGPSAQEQLQAFLQKDLGAGMIYQHVRDATRTRTHARSSPILCIFFFSLVFC